MGAFVVFLLLFIGNLTKKRWLYWPAMLLVSVSTFAFTTILVLLIGYHLVWLHQPIVHRLFDGELDKIFPPQTSNQRVDLISIILLQVVSFLPVYAMKCLLNELGRDYLYLSVHAQQNKRPVLPVTIDPLECYSPLSESSSS